MNLLNVKNLKVQFKTDEGTVHAVKDVSFSIEEKQSIGIVGESGCGKTVTSYSVLRLLADTARIAAGSIEYRDIDGRVIDLAQEPEYSKTFRRIRGGGISMIFQEPMSSLSPVHTIHNQIAENIRLHTKCGKREARERCVELLDMVGIENPAQRVDEYPFKLSGGMRQRAMIAMALSTNPRLLIADEPTTALDVTTQAQVLKLMKDTQSNFNLSMMLITHDLGVVAHMVERVYVMYFGYIVEAANTDDLFDRPSHPYTQGLLSSIPKLKGPRGKISSIPGSVPDGYTILKGCPFAPRCPKKIKGLCETIFPERQELEPGHFMSCHLAKKEN